MEENIKNRVILILAVLAIILSVGTISSCGNAQRQKFSRDKEMATRLDVEERLNKALQEKTDLGTKAGDLARALEEEKTAHQASKKSLAQEQLINQSLKEELDKVTKLKETLEEDLKEALVTGKPAKSKK